MGVLVLNVSVCFYTQRTGHDNWRTCPFLSCGFRGGGTFFFMGETCVGGIHIYSSAVIRRRWGCYGRFGPILDFLNFAFSFAGSDDQRFVV